MKSIKLARSRSEAIVSDAEERVEERRQLSAAVLWIIAAWLVGVLVSQVSVLGAEPSLADNSFKPLRHQWEQRETEFALMHSGIVALERVHHSAPAQPAAAPRTENKRLTAANEPKPSKTLAAILAEQRHDRQVRDARAAIGAAAMSQQPMLEQSIEPIAVATDDQPLTLAWQAIADDVQSQIGLVAHGTRSLMTPVHVDPIVDSASEIDPPSIHSAIAFVDTDTQRTPLIETAVQDISPDTAIVRSRPQLREVTTPAVLVSESNREVASEVATTDHTTAASEHSIVVTEPRPSEAPGEAPRVQANHRNPLPVAISTSTQTSSTPTEITLTDSDGSNLAGATERVAATWPFEKVKVESSGAGVKLNVDNADVRTVFEMLARGYQMNILVAPDVQGTVTANVDGLSAEQTLRGIVKMAGLSMQYDENLIYIYSADNLPMDARQLRVFPLDFARAVSLEPTVQGLLSPVGNAYTSTINDKDTHQTQESIVVVDIPEVIAQVENFILQADRAPRQVLIEAHVLEVQLSDDMVHGVDFNQILLSSDVTVGAFGFAEPVLTANNPRFFANISGTDISGALDLLQTTTDSKTLASPRVQVINGQNARIQVGQQLGFTVATVTQTSTIQDVQFLETGVVLNVTPTISRDDRILLQVKPEVSDGEINPATLLPEEQTREVETSVLLDNHRGVIIGGLIQERDRTVIKKLPWLGDVQYVGKLFQRREALRSRSEIIVALIPHILDDGCATSERDMIDYDRVDTRLFHGKLHRNCRPWEPRMPDRMGEEQHSPDRINRLLP